MEDETYKTGKFIALSEEAKEELRIMQNMDLDMYASSIAHSLRKTQIKLMNENEIDF